MTDDPLSMPAGARRTVWVFTVDLPEADLGAFTGTAGANGAPAPVAEALGVARVDAARIEAFDAATMRDYGLPAYLTEANGMDPESVAPDRAKLTALTGPVLLVFGEALPEGTERLAPKAPLRLVGRYVESLDLAPRTAPVSEAAKGPVGDAPRKAPSQAAMSGRIAGIALLVLFLLVAVMVWVAA